MFRNLFANIPDVTKNLLIINILFFLATMVMEGQGIHLQEELGVHYPSSPYFEPFQIVTHFFMHGDFMHILFNMFGLVVFGSQLERYWGKKRFFTFYFVTAVGAALLHTLVQGIEIHHYTGEWFPSLPVNWGEMKFTDLAFNTLSSDELDKIGKVANIYRTTTLGASGAVYGLLMAFALLFPNTQFQLLFPPIPIKAKWLATGLAAIALYSGYKSAGADGDSVAHFAHLGGMLFGFIMIQIWKRDKSNFY